MLAFFNNILLFAAETVAQSDGVWSKIVHFWNDYLSFPGFEVWKFLNLAIFIAIMYYLLKKPLSDAFKTKREAIRADLIKSEEEKKAALARLADAQAKLTTIDAESQNIIDHAKKEADAETGRIAQQTESVVAKMYEQADTGIARRQKQVLKELRRFSAEESVRLAEQKIKSAMNAAKDAELVKAGIDSIGGLK